MEEPRTLVELLRRRADERPEHAFFSFDNDGQAPDPTLSFGDLDRRARALAAFLQAEGLGGERLLILQPPGPAFIVSFFGALYAGAVPIPMARVTDRPPANPAQWGPALPRIQAIARDACAAATLITADGEAALGQVLSQQGVPRLVVSTGIGAERSGEWRPPARGSNPLAFIQYTSGSTAAPRGVMVTHENVLANCEAMRASARLHGGSRGALWLPLHHDLGLIAGMLLFLFLGAQLTYLAPLSFIKHPLRWLRLISRTRATYSGGPNFAYEACLERIEAGGPEALAGLDLSSWDLAFCGAEPIRVDTMRRFARALAPAGFRAESLYPCYGLAESTVFVTGPQSPRAPRFLQVRRERLERDRAVEVIDEGPEAQTLVGCGACSDGHRLVIVDPERRVRLPDGQVGEIWVGGPSVSGGYFRRPEDTEETFNARLCDSGEGPFLRTGDLGVLWEGELFVTGRIKDLVIVRGRNHAPADLELTAATAHPALRLDGVAAFSIEEGGEERLVVMCEVPQPGPADGAPCWQESEVTAAVRRDISEKHMVRVHDVVLIRRGGLPRTTSGKLQRLECRARYAALRSEGQLLDGRMAAAR